MRKKTSLGRKLQAWAEAQIDKGTTSRIMMLVMGTAVVVVIASLILQLMDTGSSFIVNVWNYATTAINAWMPEIEEEEGGVPWGQYIVTAFVAVTGLFVTSTLIGIISNGIEEKVADISSGKRPLYIKDHILILGYGAGTDRILEEIIRAAAGAERTVVVAEAMDRQELEEDLSLSVEIPKNITLIGRNIDITEPESLRGCSVTEAQTVIIHPGEDGRTVKAVLAVEELLKEAPESKVRVVAGVWNRNRMLPAELLDPRILLTQTGIVVASIMAKCCLNPGLFSAMQGVLAMQGSGLYNEDAEVLREKTFGQLLGQMDGAVPMGVVRDGKRRLMPEEDEKIREGDEVICFAERKGGFSLSGDDTEGNPMADLVKAVMLPPRNVLILGRNRKFGTLLAELPEEVQKVTYVALDAAELARAKEIADYAGVSLQLKKENYYDEKVLSELLKDTDQVVLLAGEHVSDGDPDADNICLYYLLRKIRKEEKLSFSVTVEFLEDSCCGKVPEENYAEFVVESGMTALMLSQAAMNPGAVEMIRELTGRGEKRLAILRGDAFGIRVGEKNIRELRKAVFARGGILIGYLEERDGRLKAVMNPSLEKKIEEVEKKVLIVLR